jgi:hypothetical protein
LRQVYALLCCQGVEIALGTLGYQPKL